ncbi:MAG: alpha/beta hydrolase [Bacteroidetes bacterium]|nr:alpha/beta hydrolase [Fibrella sp.]
MTYQVREEGEFRYVDEGQGEVLLLLHGLFGALSNWSSVITTFSDRYRVVIPMMPIYDMPIKEAGLEGLLAFIERFVAFKNLSDMSLLGNSLGGHVAILYTLKHPDMVRRMVLTGSSGLFENSMGGSFPKRGSYQYIAERVAYTFYNPDVATKELVDEVFDITSSIPKCMRIVAIAKSAQRNNVARELPRISVPTLLVWGLNDTITPPEVAHEFARLIPESQVFFIDKCCHAPMMEHPGRFNSLLERWLTRHSITENAVPA